MKILIAYDGSECADSALNDLQHAGLGGKEEVFVLSAAETWLPKDDHPLTGSQQDHIAKAVKEAHDFAEKASLKIQKNFPDWKVGAETSVDPPAWSIIRKAEEINADLIVMGSHGRSALGRMCWGSVSQSVVTHAHCSVRIGRNYDRADKSKSARLIVGVDGSSQAKAAIQRVASGKWPAGTEVRVIAVMDPSFSTGVAIDLDAENRYERLKAIAQSEAKLLLSAGLKALAAVKSGSPKSMLVAEAEEWGADCIFVGAKGLSRIERILLGSVSTAVAMRAHCSVEIVRGNH